MCTSSSRNLTTGPWSIWAARSTAWTPVDVGADTCTTPDTYIHRIMSDAILHTHTSHMSDAQPHTHETSLWTRVGGGRGMNHEKSSVRPRLSNQADQEVGALVCGSVPLPPVGPTAGTGGGVPDRRRSAGAGSAARTRSCLRHSPAAGPPDVTHKGRQNGKLVTHKGIEQDGKT